MTTTIVNDIVNDNNNNINNNKNNNNNPKTQSSENIQTNYSGCAAFKTPLLDTHSGRAGCLPDAYTA
jgi:hypothetical protein